MQDDAVALFAYDRWANLKVLDACRKLTAEQYVAEPVPGWSSVRSTIYHIAWVLLVDVLLHPHAVPPFPLADATDTVIHGTAVAVVAEVLGQHVVPGVGQMLVLNHEVDFGIVEIAPRLAEVPRIPSAAHGQSMVEDHQLVAFVAFGGNLLFLLSNCER
jgi:hypothetical protein